MEETLTDCLVRVREDLSQLKKVRDYLETNAETEEHCSVTWRTIEAFNSILSVCSSQSSPETSALDTLLDSFFYLARNNTDNSVWDDFGFELGFICVKVLSAIERTNIFEVLFCKLLSVISIICKHNLNVWKAIARQILNVLINKKFTLSYLETILKLYICILRNIDNNVLYELSTQNLHLLKTLSLLVQKVGDFEIQSAITELIYLHLSKDTKLMSNIFDKKIFINFEDDCRLYLNALNKAHMGCDKKVYSICCHVLYLGGCFVEPPVGKNSIWVDANKDTERVSIKCDDSESNGNRVLNIPFSWILGVHLENEKTEGNRCLTIQATRLLELQKDVSNDDICLVTEIGEEVYEFVQFLESEIGGKKKKKKKTSKTMDSLLIDRNSPKKEVQDNAVTSSEKPGIDKILPDVLSLFEKANQTTKESSKTSQEKKIGSQELSPTSFIESLNKHIGLSSPELQHTFEDSIETIEFMQSTPRRSHKLFRSPNKIFNILEIKEPKHFNFVFEEDKENKPIEIVKPKIRTYSRKPKTIKPPDDSSVLKERKNLEVKLSNTQSQDYFRGSSILKKKPFLPKLKRSKKAIKNTKPVIEHKSENDENEKERRRCQATKDKKDQPSTRKEQEKRTKQTKEGKRQSEQKQDAKPSLLDPNGYAYQRWCKPTTSERSNFWLKKLDALGKSKSSTVHVFEFSDEYDSLSSKNIKKKRIVHSKRKCRTKKKTKHVSLREVKEILKKTSPAKEKESPQKITKPLNIEMPKGLSYPQESHYSSKCSTSPNMEIPGDPLYLRESHYSSKCSATPESTRDGVDDSEYESTFSSEDEKPFLQNKKRERPDEGSSSAKIFIKKKPKISLPKSLLLSLRRRLKNTEEKDRRYTDEIIRTANKATNHLFNHLQRKDGERIISYLNTAETVSLGFETEIEDLDLNLRAKRIQRAVLYFNAGCSISDFCDFLNSHFSKVRDGLRSLGEKKDTEKTIERVCDRLSGLIGSEIEKSFRAEWVLKRNMLLKCASSLGSIEPETS